MSKYDVKAVVCDYGIFDNDELKIIVNSQANALLIKYILEQDLQHKVVIADLLEKKNKKKRKLRAMTISEWCEPKKCPKCEYHYGAFYCAYSILNGLNQRQNKSNPYKKRNGKYILVEVTKNA